MAMLHDMICTRKTLTYWKEFREELLVWFNRLGELKLRRKTNLKLWNSLPKAEGMWCINILKASTKLSHQKTSSMLVLPRAGPKTFETTGHCLKIQKRYCRTKLTANFLGFRILTCGVAFLMTLYYSISNTEQLQGKNLSSLEELSLQYSF